MWLTILSWGAKALPFLKSPKGLGYLSVAIAAGALWLYVASLHGTIGSLEKKNAELRETKATITAFYQQCADTNAQNLADVRMLQAVNEQWALKFQATEAERIAAVKAATERALRAEAQLESTLETLEEERNETPDCQALSRIDMGAVCPAVVDRLRKHAAGAFDQD